MKEKKNLWMGTAVILTNGRLHTDDAKTAHGLIRGTRRFDITGVIDDYSAGKDAGEVLDGKYRGLPVYAEMTTYLTEHKAKPDFAIIGLALCGGRLDEQWQAIVMEYLNMGISVINGMHMQLNQIPMFMEAARLNNAQIIDIRAAKPFEQCRFWSGRIYDMKIPRIAVLGTDCAVGKRTTSRLIVEACQEVGIHAEMIYTGQTGWLQGNAYGFILDATLNDFVSGELEDAIVRCELESRPDLMVIEGQSALRNPSGPCGSEIILSGNTKGVIIQHAPFRAYVSGMESRYCLRPDIDTEVRLAGMYGARVIAICLNGHGGTTKDLIQYRRDLEKRGDIPVVLPLASPPEGMARLMPAIREFMRDHQYLPDTSPRKKRFDNEKNHLLCAHSCKH